MMPPTGVARTTRSLLEQALTGSEIATSIARRRFAFSSTGLRSHPTILPRNPLFFRASASEPPIRPVPMIVIWRNRGIESGNIWNHSSSVQRKQLHLPRTNADARINQRRNEYVRYSSLRHFSTYRGRDHAQGVHQFVKLLGIERLRSIRKGLVR